MLEIRSDEGTLYLKASGDVPRICTELVIALRTLYKQFGESEQYAFKCFLEDLLPGMVCVAREEDDYIKMVSKAIFKRLGEE